MLEREFQKFSLYKQFFESRTLCNEKELQISVNERVQVPSGCWIMPAATAPWSCKGPGMQPALLGAPVLLPRTLNLQQHRLSEKMLPWSWVSSSMTEARTSFLAAGDLIIKKGSHRAPWTNRQLTMARKGCWPSLEDLLASRDFVTLGSRTPSLSPWHLPFLSLSHPREPKTLGKITFFHPDICAPRHLKSQEKQISRREFFL